MDKYSIKTFYSREVIMVFFIIYWVITLIIISFDILLLHFAGQLSMGLITAMTMGGVAGGFPLLLRARPTKLTIHGGEFFFVESNIRNTITDFQTYWKLDKRNYGFPWGYKETNVGKDRTLFIPLGTPRFPDGILGKAIHEQFGRLVRYGGITSVVEVKQEGNSIAVYGPYVTINKIYEEIS
jgi:hypothetical protein